MKPFIRTEQYNYLKGQVKVLINGHASANDKEVLNAIKSLALERVLAQFQDLSKDQEELFQPITEVHDKEKAELFLSQIKPYVIPFNASEQGIKKLFPKVKKLKVPKLDKIDLHEISYLSWTDEGSNKKYIVFNKEGRLIGLEGSFQPMQKKGVCTLCNKHEEVGLFLVKEKGKVQGTFTNRGNYICQDHKTCNENIQTLDQLYGFTEWVTGL